jgi:TfoX/Sxy family transcriptional regulator of competence genes
MQKTGGISAEKIAQFEKLVATQPDVERKGAANPYTSINGNMFALLHSPEGRFALRLPDAEREAFLAKYGAKLFEAYGAVMKEYVAVPDSLLANTKELTKYFAISFTYAQSLRPKATARKKATAKTGAKKAAKHPAKRPKK